MHIDVGERIKGMLDRSYTISEPDVVCEKFDGEYVILNLGNGAYYSFEGAGDEIWEAVAGGTPPASVLNSLRSSRYAFVEEAASFLETLINSHLVRPAEIQIAKSANGTSISPELGPPTITMYDDLADFILADPIHDTDEAVGWPKLNTST